MLKVAITGNIGAGKSYVSQMFGLLGIPVFYADQVSKRVLSENTAIQERINKLTGNRAFEKGGKMNKDAIFALLMQNSEDANAINECIHQHTVATFDKWASEQQKNNPSLPYCIKEAALIYESKAPQILDWVIGVDCPTSIRKYRYMQRQGSSLSNFQKIDCMQIDDAVKMKLVHQVIYNDGKQALLPQVWAVHQDLSRKLKHNSIK